MRVGIDGHCWLHRGATFCAEELADNIPTTKHVRFFMGMIDMLRGNGIIDITVVFDGLPLPAKQITNIERDKSRSECLNRARSAKQDGNTADSRSLFKRTVSVTPTMISDVIKELKRVGVKCMIAPYETDAQLTLLTQIGDIDVVVSEDSDLIVYGCPIVLFKLDQAGNCDEIQIERLSSNAGLSFYNWTAFQFKLFCCLAGCDYVKNIKSIGIKTAHKLVSATKTLPAVAEALRAMGHKEASAEYFLSLERALLTFSH